MFTSERASSLGDIRHRQTRKMLQDVARVWPAPSQHDPRMLQDKMLRAFDRALRPV